MPRLTHPLTLALVALVALPAAAGTPDFPRPLMELREVDNTAAQIGAPGVFPAGLKTFDLLLQSEDPQKILTGSQVLLELTEGEIFDLAPSLTPPNDNVGPFDPPFNELTTFDTFAAQGGDRVSRTQATLQVGAGPVGIDGSLTDAILTSTVWAQATNPAGDALFGPHEDFLLFRFNVTADAVGEARFLASVNRPGERNFPNARFDIPEPASSAALAGLLACVRRRGRGGPWGSRP